MFSERLKSVRKSRGFTAQYMANCLGIHIRAYRKYESGDTVPTFYGLKVMADVLDVSIDWLLGRDEWLQSHGVSFDALR